MPDAWIWSLQLRSCALPGIAGAIWEKKHSNYTLSQWMVLICFDQYCFHSVISCNQCPSLENSQSNFNILSFCSKIPYIFKSCSCMKQSGAQSVRFQPLRFEVCLALKIWPRASGCGGSKPKRFLKVLPRCEDGFKTQKRAAVAEEQEGRPRSSAATRPSWGWRKNWWKTRWKSAKKWRSGGT